MVADYIIIPSLLLFILLGNTAVGACQSCLVDMGKHALFGLKKKDISNMMHVDGNGSSNKDILHIHNSVLPLGILKSHQTNTARYPVSSRLGVDTSVVLGFLALRSYAERIIRNNHDTINYAAMFPTSTPKHQIKLKWAGGFFIEEEDSESKDSTIEDGKDTESLDSKESNEVVSTSMIMAIGFYKNWISPLLPPACRFLPTCSQYGVQAIEEYGPQKGLILTAWRLARCTPLGGKGYDPPKWPPVAYTYGSY